MKELHLFAGAGGGILGGLSLGHVCIGAVEIEPYCQDVLRQRQVEGALPNFPIFGDIKEFDGYEFKEEYGQPDIVCGGFPCQDISSAGKGAGIEGERSGLWSEMARVIGEIRPNYCLLENSPMLVGRGLTRVLSDLASMRYDACWRIIGADDLGAPHVRKRIWILARRQEITNVDGVRQLQRAQGGDEQRDGACDGTKESPNAPCERLQTRCMAGGFESQNTSTSCGDRCQKSNWWESEPDVVRMVHGVPRRVDRIKALGNAQVPAVAAFAFKHLMWVFENYDEESIEREGE